MSEREQQQERPWPDNPDIRQALEANEGKDRFGGFQHWSRGPYAPPADVMTKSRARSNGLKPAKGAWPIGTAYYATEGGGVWAEFYHVDDLVPVRPMTPAQRRALEKAQDNIGTRECAGDGCTERVEKPMRRGERLPKRCRSCRIRHAANEAAAWRDANPLILDTETTGIYEPEIVEIGITDSDGHTVLHRYVRPIHHSSWPEAERIHGIAPADVKNAPTWPELLAEVEALTAGRELVIYNAEFDIAAMRSAGGIPNHDAAHCAMLLYARFYGDWHYYHQNFTWQKLAAAAHQCDIEHPDAHSALADAQVTAAIVRHMANHAPSRLKISTG